PFVRASGAWRRGRDSHIDCIAIWARSTTARGLRCISLSLLAVHSGRRSSWSANGNDARQLFAFRAISGFSHEGLSKTVGPGGFVAASSQFLRAVQFRTVREQRAGAFRDVLGTLRTGDSVCKCFRFLFGRLSSNQESVLWSCSVLGIRRDWTEW